MTIKRKMAGTNASKACGSDQPVFPEAVRKIVLLFDF